MPEGFSTDSYKLPTQPPPAAIAAQYNTLDQQQLSISQAKMDQANQALGYMTRSMGSLGPNASKEDYLSVAQNASKMGLVPAEMLHVYEDRLNKAKTSPDFYREFMSAAADQQQQINMRTGVNSEKNDNATSYQGKTDVLTGGFTPTTSLPTQLGPTTPNVDTRPTINGQPNPDFNKPGYVGPSGPAGVSQARGAPQQPLPVQNAPQPGAAPPMPMSKRMLPAGPINNPAIAGPSANFGGNVVGAVADPAQFERTNGYRPNPSFNERFVGDSKIFSGNAPGVAEAQRVVGEGSGKDYETALRSARNFQADIYPVKAALEGIEKLGTQGVGPGTETFNNIKSAIVTWLPNVDPKMIDNVSTVEQTRKYLTQIARGSGSTGTNDQLAAAFEANPSIKMSSAATETVLKSIYALKTMDQAQTLMFAKTGLPDSQFTKWAGQNQNQFDPKAFGYSLMSPEAKSALVAKLNKDPAAYKKFEDTLKFALDAQLIEPPARK